MVNAISLPDTSPFSDANQIPLPNDLPIEVQTDDPPMDADEEGKGGTAPA